MVKKFLAVVLTLVMVLSCGSMAMASSVDYLIDSANVLDQDDALETLLEDASYEQGVYIVVVTTNTSYGGNIEEQGRKYCYETGLNYLRDDVILLVINMADRMYDIILWGEPYYSINTNQVNGILDHMESLMRSGDYDGAIGRFVSSVEQVWQNNSSNNNTVYIGKYVLITLAIMVVVGGIYVGVITLKYKMKLTPTNYPLEEYTQLDLKEHHDVFLSRNVTKTVVQSSSGGGGGGGSRGGHAGGRGF